LLKSPIFLIAGLVISIICGLQLGHVGAFQRLEWMTYDWRVRFAHHYSNDSANEATNLGVVEISDDTIAAVNSGEFGFKYGLYWPRSVYARALAELSRQGADMVAFDVLFAETRHDLPDVTLPDGSVVSSDAYFAHQLRNSSNAVLAADEDLLPAPEFRTNAFAVGHISVRKDADGVLRRAVVFQDYLIWHPFIGQVAEAYGLNLQKTKIEPNKITFFRQRGDEPIAFPLNRSGQMETTNLCNPIPPGVPAQFAPYTKQRIWSMGIVLAAHYLKLDLDKAQVDLPHHRIVLSGENGVTRVIPVDSEGLFYIDWSMGLNDPLLTEGSFEELLQAPLDRAHGRVVPNHWKDKLVVIGSTATGNDLADTGATALESHTFMVSKHWNVANSVITGRFVQTTPEAVTLLLIIFVGMLSAWITWVVGRPVTGSLLILITSVVYLGVSVWLFVGWRIWVPVVLPLFCAGFVTHLSALTYRVRAEQTEKKKMKSLFSRMVSPDVVNHVLEAQTISLQGIRREITIYFADIRGFTELTDSTQAEGAEFVRQNNLGPEAAENYYDEQAREVMRTVSLYLGTVADVIKKHRGTLDKYIGDCVMAFWGALIQDPEHALNAVRAAIEAQQAIAALNALRQQQNKRREEENSSRVRMGLPPHQPLPLLTMGTGINTGVAIAGFMGSDEHGANYTVFGREVNLASRLEGVSGYGRIIIGEGTFLALQRDDPKLAASCAELSPQKVKGFRKPVRIFEVPWHPAAAPTPTIAQPDSSRDNSPAVV
jgi:class 3 adenylate cyclase